LTRVEHVEEYGIADVDRDMRIERFIEKPSAKEAPSHFANAGIYLFSPEVRNIARGDDIARIVDERKRLDFGFDFLPYFVNKGYPVYGYELKTWHDVGTPERYLAAMLDILHGKVDIRIREERIFPDRNVWVQGYSEESIKRRDEIIRKCKDNRLAIEEAALIGRHTRIGDNTRICDSNIDNFCIIGSDVNIEKSAIMDAARIGDFASISDSIIGRKVIVDSTLERPIKIESTSVIGKAVHIREGCRIVNSRINPGLTVPPNATYVDKFLQSYEDIVQLSS
jgi:NDP-sugar pyrophosphorylase family protein